MITAKYVCDWCKVSTELNVPVEGPQRERLPENPLTLISVPVLGAPKMEHICDVCVKAQNAAILAARKNRMG